MNTRKSLIIAAAILLVALCAVAVAGVVVPGATPEAKASDTVALTVTAQDGTVKTFTVADVQAMTAYAGYAGFVNSAGTVTPQVPIKGVPLADLLAQAGGMTAEQSVDVVASDDFGMTFTYDEAINGAVQMYDATGTTAEAAKAPVTLVIAYEWNGQAISSEEGPLRLVVAQPTQTGQVADGHLLVKCVSKITLRGAVKSWTVKMQGLRRKNGTRQTYKLDRKTYDSCATPGCHGSSWTQPTTEKTWTGVPLFLCIGKIDGGKGHGGYGAYNERLALKGYRIKLTSTSGTSVIIGSRVIMNKETIILANKLMGSELTSDYYPMRLMGPKIGSRKFIGKIAKIQLLPK